MSTESIEGNTKSPEIFPEGEKVTLSREAQARVEVALYASGRPVGIDELAKVARIGSRRRLAELMSDLSRKINSTFSAIELKEIEGPSYSLQLKPTYNSIAKKFATKPLLSGAVLKTLSYVVYLQPVSTQELVQRRGSQAYSHLKQLIEVRFLSAERRGRTRVFRTTELFADYFGLSHDPELQRKQVAKQGLIDKARQTDKPATAEQTR
ncbi:MAG: SMC-Scp complex subunit ScpB [Thaumarchaeota archaeon]|nr:SMC-Scp complex subunit ScpB [Nitrososphaerota archaeon]MDG6907931.1 SMC-Scp complex subunit ScpB [Nitrososphaerota archaeon]